MLHFLRIGAGAFSVQNIVTISLLNNNNSKKYIYYVKTLFTRRADQRRSFHD